MPVVQSSAAVSRDVAACDAHAIYKVVADCRFAESDVFGREAERLGADLVRIQGDITDFWFTDLSLRWKQAPVAIAGLTAHGPIFCLERLAWDHGLRVVFRGAHRTLEDGRVEHSISGPPGVVSRARGLTLDESPWAARVARLVISCPDSHQTSEVAMVTAPSGHGPDGLVEPLVSWVIAPLSRSIAP